MSTRTTCALTIGGFDPTTTAGIGADLRTFAAAGVHGLGVVTVVTAQNTSEFASATAVPVDLVGAQLETLIEDITPGATKTGMLWSVDGAARIVDIVANQGLNNLVVDPVLVDGSGTRIVTSDVDELYLEKLFPLAVAITPNRTEAGLLLGRSVRTAEDAIVAAQDLLATGAGAVLVTSGGQQGDVNDVFATAGEAVVIERQPVQTSNMRGTGDTLSAALVAALATGYTMTEAVAVAGDFTQKAIRRGNATSIGRGRSSAAQSSSDWPSN